MARENIMPNASLHLFEVYNDFSGGMNSEVSNERLKDSEFPVFDNVDLSGRGSLRRRYGRIAALPSFPTGNGQGAFFYFRTPGVPPDIILAVGGKLYIVNSDDTFTELPITGLAGGFQTTDKIEAVQYGTIAYIATGTKFCQYDGTTVSVVTPYAPTPQEAIYIGTNGLAENPSAYISDGTSLDLEIAGIAPATNRGTVQQATLITCYVNKPESVTSVQYKWETKPSSSDTWTVVQDFATDTAGKTYSFIPDTAQNYDIRCTIHDYTGGTAGTDIGQALTNYAVGAVPPSNPLSVSGIQTCTKILLHWDRILLSKSSTDPFQVYVSDLENPAYFPVSNTINFDTGKREPINSLVRFRDLLLVFTKTTIQFMSGKDPSEYSKSLVHDVFGCIADNATKVVGNNIIFLSSEGIMKLVPNTFLNAFTVTRTDYQIRANVVSDENACAAVYDNMYWICFPSVSVIYRYYYEVGVWVRDTSDYFNFCQFLHYGSDVYNLTQDGELYKHDKTVYYDVDVEAGAYTMVAESKYFSLESTFNYKKLKRIYILAKHFSDHSVDIGVEVRADSAIVLTPTNGTASIDENGNAVWTVTTTPNIHFNTGTVLGYSDVIGTASIDSGSAAWTEADNPDPPPITSGLADWILGVTALGDIQLSAQKASITGKCRRVKVIFTHSSPTACEIYGFAFAFRLKRP